MQVDFSDFSVFSPCEPSQTIITKVDNINIHIIYDQIKYLPMAKNISSQCACILNFLGVFGNIPDTVLKITIPSDEKRVMPSFVNSTLVLPPRSDMGDSPEFFQFLSAKLSQLWWNNAPKYTWENWLNESFAQYSSLMVCRRHLGNDYYKSKISDYKDISEMLPPLKDFPMSHPRRHHIFFVKGSWLLSQLEALCGFDTFIILLRSINANRISDTASLCKLIARDFSIEILESFENLLIS